MTSEKPENTREQLKRARKLAIVLATTTIISLVLLVYARVQSIEAKRSFEYAVELQKQIDELKRELEQAKQISVAAQEEAMRQTQLAQKEREER